MKWSEVERASLVDTFRATDPESPTLCAGWDTKRLLAHLVMREHSPLSQIQDGRDKAEPGHEARLGVLADSAATPEDYEALIQRFAAGTGPANPFTWFGDMGQLLEYVVHHEDVRRGGPGPVEPRVLALAEQNAIWAKLGLFAKMSYRKSPVGVVIGQPNGKRSFIRKGVDTVVVTGQPVELALHMMGRSRAAHVEVTGKPDAVALFESWVASL